MDPKYSILLCDQNLVEYKNKIDEWLHNGIKVLWFGTEEDVAVLKAGYPAFVKQFLLQAYAVKITERQTIIDGRDNDDLISILEKECPAFNAAQYRVEHCTAEKHIVVQASAGTGKTTVMIDRILYLLHTQPDLNLSEIFMITFTNEAARQMGERLQDALMTRYHLTKDKRYLRWVEEQSAIHISTIHSFAYDMLKRFGINEGFTGGLSIQSMAFERKQLIKDVIDEHIDVQDPIRDQLGMPFYRANAIVNDYWTKFSQLGISHADISQMDWGEPMTENAASFHQKLKEMVTELDERYFDIKRDKDAIALNDIMRDLEKVLMEEDIPETDLVMKYLFIDEFQDSDLSQIKVACVLSHLLGAVLFVVGDVKQSIYRFRGATDKAFQILDKYMEEFELERPKKFTLRNNYRTSAKVMDRMDDYFHIWGRKGILDYREAVIPFNQSEGLLQMIPSWEKDTPGEQLAAIVSRELDLLIEKVKASGKEPTEKNRVCILTRTNNELKEVATILKYAKIPASVQQDGSFYISEAVRDFYEMITSFLFCDEPKYIFNYLLTPYAGDIEPMDLHAMERLNGDKELLTDYLGYFLDQTSWKKYHKEFRLKPVLSVIKEMFDEQSVVDDFISLYKMRARQSGWEEQRIQADTLTKARQYQADLEKLLEILQNNLGGDKVSLYDVYMFLHLNIASNRSETEAKVQSFADYTSVLCMTVHKSKGLEFDTVIIPYTDQYFGGWESNELLVDPLTDRVGWNYTGDVKDKKREHKYPGMENTYYGELKREDITSSSQEGVRVLYVGMTRVIERLICVVERSKKPMSWARLIEEVGVDHE